MQVVRREGAPATASCPCTRSTDGGRDALPGDVHDLDGLAGDRLPLSGEPTAAVRRTASHAWPETEARGRKNAVSPRRRSRLVVERQQTPCCVVLRAGGLQQPRRGHRGTPTRSALRSRSVIPPTRRTPPVVAVRRQALGPHRASGTHRLGPVLGALDEKFVRSSSCTRLRAPAVYPAAHAGAVPPESRPPTAASGIFTVAS